MPTMSFSRTIQAPPGRTFDVFADFPNAPTRVAGIKRMEVLTDGPVGKGTKFRETRIMFGKEATETMEVTDFQPGRSYSVGCTSCGIEWASTFRFTPEGAGTRVDLELSTRPITFFAKLMSPLGALMAGSMKKVIEQDMTDLQKALESGRA